MNAELVLIEEWLQRVVIGLNLCPFAAFPTQNGRVRIVKAQSETQEGLIEILEEEFKYLDSVSAKEIETTLVVVTQGLEDFFEYTQFVIWANSVLKREGWSGTFQLATFHPNYCFAGASPSDRENLTNRSPFPVLHIIREDSLEKAIEHYEDIEGVPARNKCRMESLSPEEVARLFPYLSEDK